MERRDFLKFAMVFALSTLAAKKVEAAPVRTELSITTPPRSLLLRARRFGLEYLGLRRSDEVNNLVVYQRAIFRRTEGENFELWDALDHLHNSGLDPQLADNRYGVYLPPFDDATAVPELSEPFQSYINQMKGVTQGFLDPGQTRSFSSLPDVLRMQRMGLIQHASGLIEPVLTGEAFKNSGVILGNAYLENPTEDLDINPTLYEELLESHEQGGLEELVREAARQGRVMSEWDALRVVQCESIFDSNAINPSTFASGLWQIMPLHAGKFPAEDLSWSFQSHWMDPVINSTIAVRIMESQGSEAWSCY